MRKKNIEITKYLNISEFLKEIKEGSPLLESAYMRFFNEPTFRSRDTGVSRRDISVWRKEGLLPDISNNDEVWGSFSLVQCVWLRTVSKMKKFGIINEVIKSFKENVFSQQAEYYRAMLDQGISSPFFVSNPNADLAEIKAQADKLTDEELEKILKEINYSHFGSLVFTVYLLKLKIALIITDQEETISVNIDKSLNEIAAKTVADLFERLSTGCYLLINLNELCIGFFENEKLIVDLDYYLGIMNAGEKMLIDKIRTKLKKQVTVTLRNGSILHFDIKSIERENENTLIKLSKLLKVGDYESVTIQSTEGIEKFEKKQIFKYPATNDKGDFLTDNRVDVVE